MRRKHLTPGEKDRLLVHLAQLVREGIGALDGDELDPVDIRDWLRTARQALSQEVVDKIQRLAK